MQELLDIFKMLTFSIFSVSFREREGGRGRERYKERKIDISSFYSFLAVPKCKNYRIFLRCLHLKCSVFPLEREKEREGGGERDTKKEK